MVSIRTVIVFALLLHSIISEAKNSDNKPTTTVAGHATKEVTKQGSTTHGPKGTATTTGSRSTTTSKSATGSRSTTTSRSTSTAHSATTPKVIQYPKGDPRNCNHSVPLLHTLPSYGWDNLVYNVTENEIFQFKYSQCRTTYDRKYLIPDEIYAARVTSNDEDEVKVTVIPTWGDYTAVRSYGMKTDTKITSYAEVVGTFSKDYQRAKKSMVDGNGVLVRAQLRKPRYIISFQSGRFPLSEKFRRHLVDITNYLVAGSNKLAAYEADQLVKKYGTHYLNTLVDGGVLAVEDTVKKTFVLVDDERDVQKVLAVAADIFAERFNLTSKMNDTETNGLRAEYEKARTDTKLFLYGGKNATAEADANKWIKSIAENESVIDYQGYPLYELITARELPELPLPFVRLLQKTVHEAIVRYYGSNSHPGCTNPTAVNFDFGANAKDDTCNVTASNYIFGGVYQTCDDNNSKLCKTLDQTNPATNHHSCPKGFESAPLRFKILAEEFEDKECILKCTGWYMNKRCHKVCRPVTNTKYVEYKAYWCYRSKYSEKKIAGYPFGGIYTDKTNNINTGMKSCPKGYSDAKIDQNIHVCVGKPGEQEDVAVPFGGFFSCAQGNPLAMFFPEELQWPSMCPEGYSRRTADIDQRCEIKYCTANRKKTVERFPPLIYPADGVKPMPENPGTTTLIIEDESGKIYYRKTVSSPWKVASSYKELKDAGLEGLYEALKSTSLPSTTNSSTGNHTTDNSTGSHTTDNSTGSHTTDNTSDYTVENSTGSTNGSNTGITDASTQGKPAGLSGGSIAAITIFATLAAIAAVGLGAYAYKKRSNLKRSDSKSNLHNSEAQPESNTASGSFAEAGRSGEERH